MKALVYTAPHKLAYMDFDEPVCRDGMSIVQTHAVGICGSDMHGYLGHDARRPAPLILGHEAAGEVVEGGKLGARVAVNPLMPCGACRDCAADRPHLCADRILLSMKPHQGAFADRFVVPTDNLLDVPVGVSMDKAALTEPLAVCWHAVKLGQSALREEMANARCLVIGGGAIGLGCALTLGIFGAQDVTISEPNGLRRDFVEALGPWGCVDPACDGAVQDGRYDLVFDAVGYGPTRAAASQAVRQGGVIVHLGLGDEAPGLDVRRLTLQEISFLGSYCYTPEDFQQTGAAIFDGRYGALDWMETRSLSEGAGAFADILAGKVATAKVILHP
jgi:L-iditol 2-dehydrogenase